MINISYGGSPINLLSKSNNMIILDLQYLDALQADSKTFLEIIHKETNASLLVKLIEKELFAHIPFHITNFVIGLLHLDNTKSTCINIYPIKIKSVENIDFEKNDDKSDVIFYMETNYLLVLDVDLLSYFIQEIDTFDLVDALDRKKTEYLESINKLTENRFGIISAIDVHKGFPFCGSGTYQITDDAIEITSS